VDADVPQRASLHRLTSVALDSPIGVFDSGVGGLSILHAIRRELPDEDLLYVADSANAPYGDRAESFIAERTDAIAAFLIEWGARAIVVACHTASVVAVERLRSWSSVPVVAIEPAIKPASRTTSSGVVGVLATTRTIASESVARLCAAHGDGVEILLQACPGLVERVERADLTSGETRSLLASYVSPLLAAGADTIVLGCTHYSFLSDAIRALVGPDVLLIDPAAAVARQTARRLGPNRRASSPARLASARFFSSSAIEDAKVVMSALWGQDVMVHCLPKESA
jgi:glutamate racemase